MTQSFTCKHCGSTVEADNKICPACGIPLPPDMGKRSQRRFIGFFIGLVIFCALMIYWLPPDWTNFLRR